MQMAHQWLGWTKQSPNYSRAVAGGRWLTFVFCWCSSIQAKTLEACLKGYQATPKLRRAIPLANQGKLVPAPRRLLVVTQGHSGFGSATLAFSNRLGVFRITTVVHVGLSHSKGRSPSR
ncbi:hypothetical protein F4819DRAFT_445766 [Hypoxylon fuscum]|nr:hypothetical protein F4819DRAFT_445766 [Hypoxylon fuscum]